MMTLKKIFAAVLSFIIIAFLLLSPLNTYGDVIRVLPSEGGGHYNENFPHRHPASYSNAAIAYWDLLNGLLSVHFNADSHEMQELSYDVVFYIYKDDNLIVQSEELIAMDDAIDFNLSSFGNGNYQIVIIGLDETLIGYFSR